jgi:hypothetical protein
MRRRIIEGVKPEALAPPPPATAPNTAIDRRPVEWFLGGWDGRHWVQGRPELTSQLDLKLVDRELRWDLAFKTSAGSFYAEGTATLIGDTQLELRGYYVAGATRNRALSFSLTRRGDFLEGTGIGTDNMVFQASYRKRAR